MRLKASRIASFRECKEGEKTEGKQLYFCDFPTDFSLELKRWQVSFLENSVVLYGVLARLYVLSRCGAGRGRNFI